jgi:phosphate transport system substrate-binding protein
MLSVTPIRAALLAIVLAMPVLATARLTMQAPPGWPKPKDTLQQDIAKVELDARLADYHRVDKLEGKVRSIGSSTLSNLMNRWADAFKLLYPGVEVEITGGGSGITIAALLENRTELAPMSRPMTTKELDEFQAKFGYAPTRITVGLDAIAVYVNKYNSLEAMSLKQLDGVFSASHKRGGESIKTWGQLGLVGDWADLDIAPKGPAKTHGMYGVFRELVMENGEFRYDLKSQPVSTSIVQDIGAEKSAIGFASYFFRSRRTHPLALSANDGGPYYLPDQQNCLDGKYPLSRFLYVSVNKKPGVGLSPLAGHLLGFICSKQGQETSAKEGNYPLNAEVSAKECFENL